MVVKIDSLGRILIPKGIRKEMKLETDTKLLIFFEKTKTAFFCKEKRVNVYAAVGSKIRLKSKMGITFVSAVPKKSHGFLRKKKTRFGRTVFFAL